VSTLFFRFLSSAFTIGLLLVIPSCINHETKSHSPTAELIDVENVPSNLFDPNAADSLDFYFNDLYKHKHFNGVALFAEDNNVHTLNLGFRDMTMKDSLRANDQFQLASVSKPFTAFATLLLAEEGKIHLEFPVSHYLPEFSFQEVTVEQLLTHTSGIGNYTYVTDNLWDSPANYMCNSDLLTMIECEQVPTYYEPGKTFNYCNTNYVVLAMLIERVSGLPFHQYMRERVFEPIGMFDSEIIQIDKKTPLQYDVLGHYPDGKSKPPFYLDGVVGDKGMYSTVFDLYKFYMEWQARILLSDSSWNEATSEKVKYASNSFYGYGWRVKPREENEETIIYHNGWWRGFRTYFWFSREQNKCCIILTNSIRGGYLPQEKIWSMF
jgi:CubicO group peptidase (beta-lactamase class C family)